MLSKKGKTLKDIRIFVASSKELEKERNYLAFLVLAHEDDFARRGFRVRLAKWEYVDPKMTAARTEDRYLDEMYNCDAALVLFRNIAGMYTREELDKALAREYEGCSRLKTHQILFADNGKSDSDAAKLRESLPSGSYGLWANMDDLRVAFLSLVDEVSQREGLIDVQEESLRTVSAFLAADDELAADCNAFADTILNLNDILGRRGVRVKMRFYDAAQHREILEQSEMALVLYHTNCNAFGPDQMYDAYDRTKREENPKRLYVFFRDDNDAKLESSFIEFKTGFTENLGHFFCRFENADTLKLNFLLSLENVLGDGDSFVKLDGRIVKADGLEVGEIAKLPMVAHNEGLVEVQNDFAAIKQKFEAQREVCRQHPEDNVQYAVLLKLSAKKREMEKKIDDELSRAFDLAKRMSAISAKNANETVAKARALLDDGRIDEALEVLDGSRSEIDDLLGDIVVTDDVLERKLDGLEAWIEVEFFHVDTILAHTKFSVNERFDKSESLYKMLLSKAEAMLEKYRPRLLAKILRRFAKLYGKQHDTISPVALLNRAITIYEAQELLKPGSCRHELALTAQALANKQRANELPAEAEKGFCRSIALLREVGDAAKGDLADCLDDLSDLYEYDMNQKGKAISGYEEMLSIWTELYKANPSRHAKDYGLALGSFGMACARNNRVVECEKAWTDRLEIVRRLFASDERNNEAALASALKDMGMILHWRHRYEEAQTYYAESLEHYRHLAKEDPNSYETEMASLLTRIGLLNYWNNQHEKALNSYRECVEIYRRFSTAYPGKFDDVLADALEEYATVFKDINRLNEAEELLNEAVGQLRELVKRNPVRYEGKLSSCLERLGDLFMETNRLKEAETAYIERMDIERKRSEKSGSRDALCVSLFDAATFHKTINRLQDAQKEFQEAIEIARELAVDNPNVYEVWVANIGSSYGNLLKDMGRLAEAEKLCGDSLEVRRRYAKENPSRFDESVATSLNALAILHKSMNRLADAEQEYEEALVICRRLALENPAKFESTLATSLVESAKFHRDYGSPDKASAEFSESLNIRQRLAKDKPEKFNEPVSESLTGMAVLHAKMGEVDSAIEEIDGAIAIRRILSGVNHDKFDEKLAESLHEKGMILFANGDTQNAIHFLEEALSLRKKLAVVTPEKFDKDLKDTEEALSKCF